MESRLHNGFWPVEWRRTHALALLGVLVLGLALRLYVAFTAPWYWDEGYVAEVAQGLAGFKRPQLGAFWEDGFFPLTTSILAPLSAAPFTWGPWSAMTGVRIWALLSEGLAMGLMAWVAGRSGKVWVGIVAAGLYAVLPFAVEHGGRAFYHHGGVVMALAFLAFVAMAREGKLPLIGASLCAGLAFGCCYWMWWLPLAWGGFLGFKRPKGWVLGLGVTGLIPVAVMAFNFWADPAGALWSFRAMLVVSSVGGPEGWMGLGRELVGNFYRLPFLALGILGLGLAARREGGVWGWAFLCLLGAVLELVRQRARLWGMPYPFIMAAPFAALGAGYLVCGLAAWRRLVGWVMLAGSLVLFFVPQNLSRMGLWSFRASEAGELKDFFDAKAAPGDLVCGLSHFNWSLKPRLRVCEPAELGLAEGRDSSYYPMPVPASRFAEPCRIQDLRYVVMSRLHLLSILKSPGILLAFLEMERQGWPLVFDNRVFKVFENPRFGAKRDPASRLIRDPAFYKLAEEEAAKAHAPELERFAAMRLKS